MKYSSHFYNFVIGLLEINLRIWRNNCNFMALKASNIENLKQYG